MDFTTKINTNKDEDSPQPVSESQKKRPDEHSGIQVEGHIKIFDPETEEVFVNGRA